MLPLAFSISVGYELRIRNPTEVKNLQNLHDSILRNFYMIQSLRLRLYVSPGKSCSMSNETPEEQEQEQEMILSTQEFSVVSHSL